MKATLITLLRVVHVRLPMMLFRLMVFARMCPMGQVLAA